MAFDRRETMTLIIGDFCILVVSLWLSLVLRNLAIPPLSYFELNLSPFLPIFLLSLVVFYIAGLYEKQTRPIRRVMSVRIFGAQVATVTIAAIVFFILPLTIAPKTILFLYLLISVPAESLWRFYRMIHEMKEGSRDKALLIGSGPSVQELYEEVNNNDRYLIRFVSRIEPRGTRQGIAATVSKAAHEGIGVVVIDTATLNAATLPELYQYISGNTLLVTFASLYEEIFDRVPLAHLNTSQLLESLPKRHGVYDVSKRLFDIILAIAASLVAIPFIVIAAVILWISDGSPFIYSERVGKGGRVFKLMKLRSMLFNDHGDATLQKQNRVTPFGRFLRSTRIDELPQLLNVIRGDLSFIGPRPELPRLTQVYEKEIPEYRLRYLIAPGLSGWAQIHDYDAPRGGADVERTKRKISFDLYYLKHRSFGLDLAIAFKTFRTLLAFSGT